MNLIVYYTGGYMEGRSEIQNILTKFGDQKAEMEILSSGIIGVVTKLNPRELVSNIREKFFSDPEYLRFTSKWIPVDFWVETDNVLKTVKEDIKPVMGDVLYRVDFEVHKGSADYIEQIKEIIKGRLNEDYPQRIIRVDVFDKMSAVGLLSTQDVLSK